MPPSVVEEAEENSSPIRKDRTIVSLEQTEESLEDENEASIAMPSNSRLGCCKCFARVIQISTLADAVPPSWLLRDVLSHGKMVAACVAAIYVGFLVLVWVPLWLLSKLITEIGVYVLIVSFVFLVGRMVVRWLAFPGASRRLSMDISSEFSKYSIRLLGNAADAGLELAQCIQRAENKNKSSSSNFSSPRAAPRITTPRDIHVSLARMLQYRDRILVGYRDVLSCLYYEGGIAPSTGQTASLQKDSGLDSIARSSVIRSSPLPCSDSTTTIYGTSRLNGDIGPYPTFSQLRRSTSPNPVDEIQETIIEQLSKIISDLDSLEGQLSNNKTAQTAESTALPSSCHLTAASLASQCTALKSTITLLSTPRDDDDSEDSLRGHLQQQQQQQQVNVQTTVKTAWSMLLATLDPLYDEQESELQPAKSHCIVGDDVAPTMKIKGSSVFNIHVLRGCFLSRYIGAQQFWVPRPRSSGGGFIDCVIIPPLPSSRQSSIQDGSDVYGTRKIEKAVLYCNPNAGMYEVATGMNLMGGNLSDGKRSRESVVGSSHESTNWADFYLREGYHVILFNYAGYGRSHGDRCCTGFGCCWDPFSRKVRYHRLHDETIVSPRNTVHRCECWLRGRLRRIFFTLLFGWRGTASSGWRPSPQTLKTDGLAVATYISDSLGIEKLVIHGESIGGMVAASTAKELSCGTAAGAGPSVLLLVCDRTFSNLVATAQRLVGGWTGPAIRMLVPFWNTDVAKDFQNAKCPKVVANDAADAIIADAASLRSGLAVARELFAGKTTSVGMMWDAPAEYRMAEWEGVGVNESRFNQSTTKVVSAPIWPKDKHFTVREAFHFAACVRRIGNVASSAHKMASGQNSTACGPPSEAGTDELGIELSLYLSTSGDEVDLEDRTGTALLNSISTSPTDATAFLVDVWKILSCCDGLCGSTLGTAALGGSDCVVAWLCSAVVFGCQTVAAAMERRLNADGRVAADEEEWEIASTDFAAHLGNNSGLDKGSVTRSVAMTHAISHLKQKVEGCDGGSTGLVPIERELRYCIDTLEYVVARITSTQVLKCSLQNLHFRPTDETTGAGSFVRLHCGHNNHFSSEEKEYLKSILRGIHD